MSLAQCLVWAATIPVAMKRTLITEMRFWTVEAGLVLDQSDFGGLACGEAPCEPDISETKYLIRA